MSVLKPLRGLAAAIAIVGFVVGVWMGLSRIGWSLGSPPSPGTHGPIIVLGFLGAVIGLERAVAMDRAWAWVTPFASAGAVVAMIAGAPSEIVALLLLVGGAVLVVLFGAAYRMQPETHIVMMGVGAGAWVLAALSWLGGEPVPSLVPWLAAFLVLTIAGERLELARMIARTNRAGRQMAGATAVVVVGAALAWVTPELGARIAGLGILLVAIWLIFNDVARRTIKLHGVTRYMAAGLLMGYGWLAVSGVLWVLSGLSPSSQLYDGALHALFLGFVMSMIMAHAPIVIPALAGLPFPFTRALWLPLMLLEASIALRIVGGVTSSFELRRWGALVNASALGLFLLMVAGSVVRGQTQRRSA